MINKVYDTVVKTEFANNLPRHLLGKVKFVGDANQLNGKVVEYL